MALCPDIRAAGFSLECSTGRCNKDEEKAEVLGSYFSSVFTKEINTTYNTQGLLIHESAHLDFNFNEQNNDLRKIG